MVDFPTLSLDFDASSYKVSTPNPAADAQETDGAYFITRPRYTRTPPKTFTFKFVDISQSDKEALDTFFKTTVKGSSLAFNWRDPTDDILYNVRFSKGYVLEFERTGYGTNNRYDTNDVSLTEV